MKFGQVTSQVNYEHDNYSERQGDPPIIAIAGNNSDGNEYQLGTREYDWHQHIRGQLFCVETGLIQVYTENGSWLLPPCRAGWMPPNVSHKVRVSGAMSGWTLFMEPTFCAGLPDEPCVVMISPLLKALADRVTCWDIDVSMSPEKERIGMVILDEIRRSPHESLHIPMPKSSRLLRIAHAIIEKPDNVRLLDEWAEYGAMSSRTLRRLFIKETGLNFTQWNQQVKLMHALNMLAQGKSVSVISDTLGYSTPSNFIAMFRKVLGDTPAHYFSG